MKYINKVPVWAFCACMFFVSATLLTASFIQMYLLGFLLLVILTEDVVFRIAFIVSGRFEEFKSLLAPVTLVVMIVYLQCLQFHVFIVQSNLFLVVFSVLLVLVFFLILFPNYFYPKKDKKM